MLLWFYGTPMIPVLLMGVLMHNPKIFYPLNNKVLEGVIGVVAIVSTYIWAAMLVGWGIMCLLHFSHLRHVQDASNVVTLKQ